MKETFSVTVKEFSVDLKTVVNQYTELESVSEEEALIRAEDLMFAIGEEGTSDSIYCIYVHDVDEDGAYIYETLWAKRLKK